ncbi:MAG: phosphoenolpyruvate synthase [candidate division WS6 bacterium OLB20]|uniref:Phosphoenolpyruvate synthase n=1 Tax=candidate division WS6 bacterium OLB20 TaxID=1617426 RepID=A0A136LZJ2_9BACT|nr:MAG: phosphoenolpyruvate synthase [candidate division WS6 bacterium OLB20]
MNDFYLHASVNPEYLLGEPEHKRSFIKEVVAHLKPLLELLENKTVLLKAHDLDYEHLSKLQGNQSIDFNTRHLSGAGKFVANPKLLELELEILAILRNRESLRNIWLAVPNVNSADELTEVKKIISSYGFRRSSTFKLYALITRPLGMLSLKTIVDHEIDAVGLDIDRILDNLFGDADYTMTTDIATFLGWAVRTINSNKSRPVLMNRKHDIDKETLQLMVEKGLTEFIVPQKDLYQSRLLVSSIEITKVTKRRNAAERRKRSTTDSDINRYAFSV